jgi:bile salt-stimulated lipase
LQPPRPIPAWIGEISATTFGSMCIQYNYLTSEKVEGSEDCLYLNVYVPVQEKGRNRILLPVLFWIHGGAFQFESGMTEKPTYLMDHDVIFVTINYRLGPMGIFPLNNYTLSFINLKKVFKKFSIMQIENIITNFFFFL